MTEQNEGTRGPRYVIIFESTQDEFCKKLDEAVRRGAEFLPETFQFVSLPNRAVNYVGMIRVPARVHWEFL